MLHRMNLSNRFGMKTSFNRLALSVLLISGGFHSVYAAELTKEDLQAEILQLKAQMQKQQQQLDTLIKAQEQLAAQSSTTSSTSPTATSSASQPTLASSASSSSSVATGSTSNTGSDTSIGGYGEITYNNYRKDGSRDQMDLRRFVLFFGHRFTDRLSFNSEVEWEHAVTSAEDQGESEIEQAYLNYQASPNLNIKAGLFLMPFGFLNTSHEPPSFYGVERNEVETRIIPSTWREGGVGFYGSNELGLDWDLGITTGFNLTKFDDAGAPLAGSHQELQMAQAHDLAYYGALNYRGVPGLTLGGALFAGNGTQGNASFKADPSQPDFTSVKGRVTLGEVHARWQSNGFDLEALYAKGKIGDAGKIDTVLETYNTSNSDTRSFVPQDFYGWLVQGAYTVWSQDDLTVTPFVRYEKYNTQSHMPDGFAADPANQDRVGTVGVSFKPVSQVVVKADYQKYWNNSDNNRFNLGLGYMF